MAAYDGKYYRHSSRQHFKIRKSRNGVLPTTGILSASLGTHAHDSQRSPHTYSDNNIVKS